MSCLLCSVAILPQGVVSEKPLFYQELYWRRQHQAIRYPLTEVFSSSTELNHFGILLIKLKYD